MRSNRPVSPATTSASRASRTVSLVITADTARALWARAQRFSVEVGGRFGLVPSAIVLYSKDSPSDEPRPIGSLLFAWHWPAPATATIVRFRWDPAAGGSEAELWRALDVLSGGHLDELSAAGS